MSNKFTFIDLFSGIGGFKMALTDNGGKCIGFSEINKDAIETYCDNYNTSPDDNFGDITSITELPYCDIITAGVPCQSWSIAGKNLGFNDDRGQLWNDTIYLLNQSKPKAFIFENVKGLVDPRNKKSLNYILNRIKEAGYTANFYVINSHDYGVVQNRIRIYIIGFLDKQYYNKFQLPKSISKSNKLSDILGIATSTKMDSISAQTDLFGNSIQPKQMSLSSKNGFNDYFLFNDLRNGHTTIHSWDIITTTDRQKSICMLLLRNRRKSQFGPLDGNPLSLMQFQSLNNTITPIDLDELVSLEILKKIDYRFKIIDNEQSDLTDDEQEILNHSNNNYLVIDELKTIQKLKIRNISISKTIESLTQKLIIESVEVRFDFKNTKISSGLNGVNRVFMPSSDVFPTLVASDTNDYISLKDIVPTTNEQYKNIFLDEVYFKGNYRKISKEEACLIQGFPKNFKLPESRARWMKLIGNSVSVPVIDILIKSIIETDVFETKLIKEKAKLKKSKAVV